MGPRLQLSRKGKIVGEYDLEKLRVMKDEGRIFPGDYLWMNGWTEWQKAIEYLETAPATEPLASVEKPAPKKRRRRKKQLAEGESAEDAGEEESDESQAFPWGKALGLVAAFLVILNTCSSPETNRKSIPTTLAKARQEKQAKEKAAQKASTTATNPSAPATKTPPARISYSFTGFGIDGKELFASSALAYAGVIDDGEPDEDAPKDAANYYYEGNGQVAVALSGVRKGDRFRVTVNGDRFIKPSKFEFVAEEDEAYVAVSPNTILDYEALLRLRQSVPFNVTYTVQRGEEKPRSETETWIAHQINDCQTYAANYYLTKDGQITTKPYSATYGFAGFVNENHPWIDAVLKEAIETRLCDGFYGYQQGDKGVLPQVNAIWTALQRRRIAYSNVATSTTSSGGNAYQHVRFIDESITAAQANCIDGSIVLASIFRKIGLNVSIILVPNHAYVALSKDDDSEFLFAIETTMVGSASLEEAIDYGTEKGPLSLSKIGDKLGAENDAYQEINLRLARKIGVQPIPFSR